jgi:hypothetical protein
MVLFKDIKIGELFLETLPSGNTYLVKKEDIHIGLILKILVSERIDLMLTLNSRYIYVLYTPYKLFPEHLKEESNSIKDII